jgi:hypothetical protein
MGMDCVLCEAETESFMYKVDERHSSNQMLGFNPEQSMCDVWWMKKGFY